MKDLQIEFFNLSEFSIDYSIELFDFLFCLTSEQMNLGKT